MSPFQIYAKVEINNQHITFFNFWIWRHMIDIHIPVCWFQELDFPQWVSMTLCLWLVQLCEVLLLCRSFIETDQCWVSLHSSLPPTAQPAIQTRTNQSSSTFFAVDSYCSVSSRYPLCQGGGVESLNIIIMTLLESELIILDTKYRLVIGWAFTCITMQRLNKPSPQPRISHRTPPLIRSDLWDWSLHRVPVWRA